MINIVEVKSEVQQNSAVFDTLGRSYNISINNDSVKKTMMMMMTTTTTTTMTKTTTFLAPLITTAAL